MFVRERGAETVDGREAEEHRGSGVAQNEPAQQTQHAQQQTHPSAPLPPAYPAPPAACRCPGCPWPSLFVHFVFRHGVVPLGLFRDRRHLGAALPYVHTNPALGRLCREGDVVFVLVPVGRERGAEEKRRREGA